MAKAGDKVERWVLERKLDEGGQGRIWRARAGEGESPVAIKIVTLSKEKKRARFLNELEVHRALSEEGASNVMPLLWHGISEVEGGVAEGFLVMPLATSTLDKAAKILRGRLDLCLEVVRGVAVGVAQAHQRGIIHRDIKPANVLFLDDELRVPLVSDFGICLVRDAGTRLTDVGETVGARFFMAPEQEEGGVIDVKLAADVYALGKLLHHLYTSRLLSREKLEGAFTETEMEQEPRLASLLTEVLTKSIAEAPEQRFQDAKAFVQAIDSLRRSPVGPAPKPNPPPAPTPATGLEDVSERSVKTLREITSGGRLAAQEHTAAILKSFSGAWESIHNEIAQAPEKAKNAASDLILRVPELTALTIATVRADDPLLFRPYQKLLERIVRASDSIKGGYLAVLTVPHALAGFQYMLSCVAALHFESWQMLKCATNEKFEWSYQSGRPLFSFGFQLGYFFHHEALGRRASEAHDLYRGVIVGSLAESVFGIRQEEALNLYLQAQLVLSLRAAQEVEKGGDLHIWPDFGRFHDFRVLPLLRRIGLDDVFAQGLLLSFAETRATFIERFDERLRVLHGAFNSSEFFWDSIEGWSEADVPRR